MKTTYLLPLFGSILFSLLMYDQSIGINLFLVSLTTAALLLLNRKKREVPWPFLMAYLITGLSAALYVEPHQVFVHLISLIMLIGVYASPKSSVYLSGIIGGMNLFFGSTLSRSLDRKNGDGDTKYHDKRKYMATGIGIVITMILLLLFTSLYSQGNPDFAALFKNVDLSFINFGGICFTFLGLYLYLNIVNSYNPEKLVETDLGFTNNLNSPQSTFTQGTLQQLYYENLWGKIILGVLNLLLILYLVLDIIYLQKADVLSAAGHSQAVHQGVYSLIFSMVCAMAIIVFIFRGSLNFYQKNEGIKKLSYSWLLLNGGLILTTVIKNGMYILHSGLTYKRIGVFMFLILTAFGLVTVYLKIARKKSFVYLLRTNSIGFFAVMCLFAIIPWNLTVTTYNLKNIPNPDVDYLLRLEDSNAPLLYEYSAKMPHLLSISQLERIQRRQAHFLQKEKDKNWREYNYYHLTH